MGQWGKLRSYRLAEFTASVVAAPSLAGAVHELSVRGELPMVCLDKLEQHTRKTLAAIGLTAQADRALRVDSYRDVVQAAEEGLGVAVMYGTRKTPAVANDRLVALSSQPLPVPFATIRPRSKAMSRWQAAAWPEPRSGQCPTISP